MSTSTASGIAVTEAETSRWASSIMWMVPGSGSPTNVLDTEPRGEAYAPPDHYACPAAHGIVRLAKGDTISLLVHNAQASTVGMWGWAISAHLVSKTTERKHP